MFMNLFGEYWSAEVTLVCAWAGIRVMGTTGRRTRTRAAHTERLASYGGYGWGAHCCSSTRSGGGRWFRHGGQRGCRPRSSRPVHVLRLRHSHGTPRHACVRGRHAIYRGPACAGAASDGRGGSACSGRSAREGVCNRRRSNQAGLCVRAACICSCVTYASRSCGRSWAFHANTFSPS
jgi:hypothetical protein